MANLTIYIECNNAAFEDDISNEIQSILKRAGDNIFDDSFNIPLRDTNGNKVGYIEFYTE